MNKKTSFKIAGVVLLVVSIVILYLSGINNSLITAVITAVTDLIVAIAALFQVEIKTKVSSIKTGMANKLLDKK